MKPIQIPDYIQDSLKSIKPEDYKSVLEFIVEKIKEGQDAMLLEIMENNGVPTNDDLIVSSVKNAMLEYGKVCEDSLDVGVLSDKDIEDWYKNKYTGSMHDFQTMLKDFQFHLVKVNREWRNK